ncbi:hypothetical protein B0A50_05119 [Salinomyces thailandicus]|uniref:Uncharacterized protein n=1 Tax=Salinomyces thailandicus TaxID=706561 RepID=A0A4U0TVH5_9PEZI|nr:hypothetical protein B0A50_05119 [Salinomyces thailandica]
MGYECRQEQCYALSAAAVSSSSSAEPSKTGSSASLTTNSDVSTAPALAGTAVSNTEATQTPSTSVVGGPVDVGSEDSSSSQKFSGTSFAAGIVPGIFLGALLCGCLLFYLLRRNTTHASSYVDREKGQMSRDTLTDLGTISRPPPKHGRSISEPVADASVGHRTDFLRGTPPQQKAYTGPLGQGQYSVEATGPITPTRTPKAVKALLRRSPFLNETPSTPRPTQPPLPQHLKRGTLSFKISPVRALKKQKSMHSLRRQMTDAGSYGASRSSSRRTRPDTSRTGSTETIQVLMGGPERYMPDQGIYKHDESSAVTKSSTCQAKGSVSTWQRGNSGQGDSTGQHAILAATPYAHAQHTTPTRPPGPSATQGRLGTPYTPTTYPANGTGRVTEVLVGKEGGLQVVREPEKRDTTFSAMMQRAGLRGSDLDIGTGAY